LLTNAAKYSPKADRIIVKIVKNPGHLTVAVKDFGVGVAKNDQERIFDRFYQMEGKVSKDKTSLGLGLFISKAIVERHGGRIWVKSSNGSKHGSTFYFTLPLRNKR